MGAGRCGVARWATRFATLCAACVKAVAYLHDAICERVESVADNGPAVIVHVVISDFEDDAESLGERIHATLSYYLKPEFDSQIEIDLVMCEPSLPDCVDIGDDDDPLACSVVEDADA